MAAHPTAADLTVRPLAESDLEEADRVMRVAFGTFIGMPEPERFMGDAAHVRPRWTARPEDAFAAEAQGRLVGTNFATRWGSFAFFGPLTLHPRFWDRGYARRLIEPVMERFDEWGVTHAGLFTFPNSPKHLAMYQKFGFRPRALTLLMRREVGMAIATPPEGSCIGGLDPDERAVLVDGCRAITDAVYPGLDVTCEIDAVLDQGLGETVVVRDGEAVRAFAACHTGPGSEAGSGSCYVKFGAVMQGPQAGGDFVRLLDACAAFARSRGATTMTAGVSAARTEAYETMLRRGFDVVHTGVAMHRPNEEGFCRPGMFVLDDWR
jgi:GNAT superfamily N-acetyltransferase